MLCLHLHLSWAPVSMWPHWRLAKHGFIDWTKAARFWWPGVGAMGWYVMQCSEASLLSGKGLGSVPIMVRPFGSFSYKWLILGFLLSLFHRWGIRWWPICWPATAILAMFCFLGMRMRLQGIALCLATFSPIIISSCSARSWVCHVFFSSSRHRVAMSWICLSMFV